MKVKRGVMNEPWRSICREEWKRARTITKFYLKSIKHMKFFWDTTLGSVHGRCHAGSQWGRNYILLNADYQQENFLGTKMEEEFRLLLRHEFAHINTPGYHGKDFMIKLEQLGGTRYVSSELNLPKMSVAFMPASRKKAEQPKVDVRLRRQQLAQKNLKQAETRFKRAKTLLQKWQRKVKYYSLK